jgi:hypothetical protein
MSDHRDVLNHKLRLHIAYRELYAADLRKIVRTFESAYNLLQRASKPDGRMRRSDRLTIQAVRTGNSLTLIALGGIGLALLDRLLAARERFWKSEDVKWRAKTAKLEYQERQEKNRQVEAAPNTEIGVEDKAAQLLETLIRFVNRSKEITSIEVEIDGQDTDPDKPGILIIPTGRKFR